MKLYVYVLIIRRFAAQIAGSQQSFAEVVFSLFILLYLVILMHILFIIIILNSKSWF